MSPSTAPSNAEVLRRLLRVSPPRWGIVARGLALGLLAAASGVGLLAGSGALVDRAALRPGLGAIAGLLAAVEVVAVLRAPLRYAEQLSTHDAAFRALAGWRVWVFDRLEPLAPGGLWGWRSGDVASRALEDVDSLQDLYLRGLNPLVVALGVSALAVVVVSVLLPWAGLVLGASLLLALVGAPMLALAGRQRLDERAGRAELSADVVDLLQGAAELLAFGRVDAALERIDEEGGAIERQTRRRTLASAAASALTLVCAGGAVVGTLALAVAAVHRHQLEGIMLAVLPLTALGAFEPVRGASAAALGLADALSAGRRLLAVADRPPPVTDPPSAERWAVPSGCPAVAFERASLRYRPELGLALEEVNLRLEPGGRLAVVGRSGSGKSSLVSVLLRFWPLESGTVAVGAVPIERLAQREARGLFGLLDQAADLFAGSIRHNLTLGRPDAGDDAIAAALSSAQLAEWVAGLPDGLETAVGEHGGLLSGGQRQRVALARALLFGAPVLVLDEPTVGLERPLAEQLLRDVLAAASGRSVLLVAHDDEGLDGFAEIAVLEEGRIVGRRPGPPG
ncbi:MAG TPA: thiol reductant ABC exporter subunit CydC [Acidimicrobiales bacterium]|nr:thiol reductant ABC exporter subunit CydC [Acidimicrobiales bacterium]